MVSGVIRGLHDNATGAASSVEVLYNANGFGVGEYVGSPTINTFSVAAGVLTSANFTSFGILNTSSGVTCCSLTIKSFPLSSAAPQAGLTPSDGIIIPNLDVDLSITPALAPVPLPAGLPLVLTGLAGFAGLRMRKKRKAQV